MTPCRLVDGYYHDNQCNEITDPPSEVQRPKHGCSYVKKIYNVRLLR